MVADKDIPVSQNIQGVFKEVKDLANHGAITGVRYAVTHMFANISFSAECSSLHSSYLGIS